VHMYIGMSVHTYIFTYEYTYSYVYIYMYIVENGGFSSGGSARQGG